MPEPETSRRNFVGLAAVATGAALLGRGRMCAEGLGIVPTMVNAAAKAKILVQPVRRNISAPSRLGGQYRRIDGKGRQTAGGSRFCGLAPRCRKRFVIDRCGSHQGPDQHALAHGSHDGNAWLHSRGAFITAHENTRKRLSVATRVDGWQWTFPAAPAGALPEKVFSREHELRRNHTRIAMKYYGPAHTDSDVWVHFTDADVVHVGDTWWNGVYPFIDYSTGGSIDGQIQAAEANLAHSRIRHLSFQDTDP